MKRLFSIFRLSGMLWLIVFSGFSTAAQSWQNKATVRASGVQRFVQEGLQYPDFPLLKLTDKAKEIVLPSAVDNSKLAFLPPVYSQGQNASCQQASTIVYNFCYEMNRLRNVAADTLLHRYPDHFAWNFLNATEPYYGEGVSYFHSFDIMYEAGTPSLQTYGEITDRYTWMSNYDGYLEAMHNRITGAHSIAVGTPEGLTTLKHWLHNHLEGAETGGIATFGAGMPWNPEQIPDSLPEGGKHVQTHFLFPASHAMTIVGYNDSVRFDVNGDGKFTNQLDINGDETVDMRDWEIGALKYVNSYGPDWMDSGYCFMLYRTLALPYQTDGIWNNSVQVLTPDTTTKPLLTLKTRLTCNKRGRIKIMAGISADTSVYYPQHFQSFTVFNYQGGDFPMSGSSQPLGDSLELGLDISPLLSYTKGQTFFRIFLVIEQNDPDEQCDGKILSFSVISHPDDEKTMYRCTEAPFPFANDGLTMLSVVVNATDKAPVLAPDGPFYLSQNKDTSLIFNASEGTPPYQWTLQRPFTEKHTSLDYVPLNGTPVTPGNSTTGFAAVPLPFEFPFFGKTYDTLYMHVNGYLVFDAQDMPYYYLLFDESYFPQLRNIAGYMNHTLGLVRSDDHMSYAGSADSIVFEWRISKIEGTGTVQFSTILFPDGSLKHHYGLTHPDLVPVIGVCDGQPATARHSVMSGAVPHPKDQIALFPSFVPDNLYLTENGVLTIAASAHAFSGRLDLGLTDAHRLRCEKTIVLSSGPVVELRLSHPEDLRIAGSEHALTLILSNYSSDTLKNCSIEVLPATLNCSITGNGPLVSDLLPRQSLTLVDQFSVLIHDTVTAQQSLAVEAVVSIGELTVRENIQEKLDLLRLRIDPPRMTDPENPLPAPGDEVPMRFSVVNESRIPVEQLALQISVPDLFGGVSGTSYFILGTLNAYAAFGCDARIAINEAMPPGKKLPVRVEVVSGETVVASKTFEFEVGQAVVAVVDLSKYHNLFTKLRASLESLNTGYHFYDQLLTEALHYPIVFLNLGYGSSTYYLNPVEDSSLVSRLRDGGHLYAEAGYFFYLESQLKSQLNIMAGTGGITAPPDTLLGVNNSPAQGLRYAYRGISNYIMNLIPVEPAQTWLRDKHTDLGFVVANDNGQGRSIASSIQFDGLDSFDGPDRDEILKRYLSFFGYSTDLLVANFTVDRTNLCKAMPVQFSPWCGGNPISWHWTFEGGEPATSDENAPAVVYPYAGIYDVSLTVSDGSGQNTFTLKDLIRVEDCSGSIEKVQASLALYPNPASETVWVNFPIPTASPTQLLLRDLKGQLIRKVYLEAGTSCYTLSVSGLAHGVYLLEVHDNQHHYLSRLLH